MSTLRQTIENQAVQFAEAIVNAVRAASIDELVGIQGGTRGAPRAPSPRTVEPSPVSRKGKGGRLVRRSAEDIAKTLDSIVDLLAQHPEGLRAEQIKESLGLDKREMPKPIAEGLNSGALKKSGQKRATVYTVGGGAAAKGTKQKGGSKKK
ncbi:MAG TPA: hypothetical protein VM580_02330 [Labilithrix sp.]|nr:hypothetical protein [Labilithrix sp.]